MHKVIIILFFLFQSLHAFLNTDNNDYEQQLTALKNFDLPNTFLKDPIFISMKEDVEVYKTKHFLKTLENGDKFVPILQKMMQEAGVPAEFLYLAMTESSFNPYSSSAAHASGIWQFIPTTARSYGLANNSYVDERREPIKSTKAAITYLKYLHNMFGKWYLAALAYNCGEGTVMKAIAKAGTDDISVLLDADKKYLPKESRLYIRKILMMSSISNSTEFMLNNGSEYLLNRANNATFVKVTVKNGTSLKDVADSISISQSELKAYNPHLKHAFVPPVGSSQNYLYIPQDRQITFAQNFDQTKEPQKYIVYTAQKGDSLRKIAKKYDTSFQELMRLNNLKSAALRPKTELIVPFGTPPSSKAVQHNEKIYIVKAGDTAETVSKKYDISVAKLLKANNKKKALVQVGESIVIPKD